jgi:hypothetical protein
VVGKLFNNKGGIKMSNLLVKVGKNVEVRFLTDSLSLRQTLSNYGMNFRVVEEEAADESRSGLVINAVSTEERKQ